MLRSNGVDFEPLHPETNSAPAPSPIRSSRQVRVEDEAAGDDKVSVPAISGNIEVVNMWNAMNQKSGDSEDEPIDGDDVRVSETVVKHPFEHVWENQDTLLFSTHLRDIDTKTLHPSQGHIMKLWQIYLENVNPVLKVTHTPTLQPRMIDAAVNLTSVTPRLEALMFAVYSVAISSMHSTQCQHLFGSSKEELLRSFQFACKQAMMKPSLLNSGDREYLTALFLYFVSYRPGTNPRTMAPMLGVAVRLAQRMGIDNENSLAKCSALEAELRRRLWWALTMFDNRMCEMSHFGSTSLLPTWHCRPVVNLNDADLRSESRVAPAAYDRPTDAIFTVVRSEVGDFIRGSASHLSFTNPPLIALAKDSQHTRDQRHTRLLEFEQHIEQKFFEHCNPDDPLHFFTIWSTRTLLARLHVLQYYVESSELGSRVTNEQRDSAALYAARTIECDTNLARAPHVQGFRWHVDAHFPAPAYIHLVQDIRRRPRHQHARKCWEFMNENYLARFLDEDPKTSPFIKILSTIILQAWDAYEAALADKDKPTSVPDIVSGIVEKIGDAKVTSGTKSALADPAGMRFDSLSTMHGGFGEPITYYDIAGQSFAGWDSADGLSGPGTTDFDLSQFDLTTMDWNPLLLAPGRTFTDG